MEALKKEIPRIESGVKSVPVNWRTAMPDGLPTKLAMTGFLYSSTEKMPGHTTSKKAFNLELLCYSNQTIKHYEHASARHEKMAQT